VPADADGENPKDGDAAATPAHVGLWMIAREWTRIVACAWCWSHWWWSWCWVPRRGRWFQRERRSPAKSAIRGLRSPSVTGTDIG
jgi:hypothetical protein